MATGTVKWFDPDRGFGFIAPSDGSPDRFVHRRGFGEGLLELAEGDLVEFDADVSPRGPVATNIRVTERSGIQPRQPRSDGLGSFGNGRPLAGERFEQNEDVGSGPSARGSVQRFDVKRGFGFIRDDRGEDIFVHKSATGFASLRPGDLVEFRIVTGPKGARAEQVRKIYA